MANSGGPSKFLMAGTKTGLPDEILVMIGEITLNWNRAEVVLEQLIWTIAGWGQKTGAFVTHDLGNVARDQLCKNFLHDRLVDAVLKENLITLLLFTSELRTRRNSLIHSIPTAQLLTEDLPALEKRSAKAAVGEIRVTQFLVGEIEALRLDIAMATSAAAYAAAFVQRDLSFSLSEKRLLADERTLHVWGGKPDLPYIYHIRNRLKTIRSQHPHQDKNRPPP